jgi:hypothetical protein
MILGSPPVIWDVRTWRVLGNRGRGTGMNQASGLKWLGFKKPERYHIGARTHGGRERPGRRKELKTYGLKDLRHCGVTWPGVWGLGEQAKGWRESSYHRIKGFWGFIVCIKEFLIRGVQIASGATYNHQKRIGNRLWTPVTIYGVYVIIYIVYRTSYYSVRCKIRNSSCCHQEDTMTVHAV